MATVVKHLPVSNVSWLLGLIPVQYLLFQYLFVIFNASQGVFIFTLHMMCSGQIRALLRTRLHASNGVGEGNGKRAEEELSKSGSTGNTMSLEMDVVGQALKTISFKRRPEV